MLRAQCAHPFQETNPADRATAATKLRQAGRVPDFGHLFRIRSRWPAQSNSVCLECLSVRVAKNPRPYGYSFNFCQQTFNTTFTFTRDGEQALQIIK